MRYKLSIRLENEVIPLDYRRYILSYIKYVLSQSNIEYYKKLYNERDNIIKPYTFSTYFPQPKFSKESININSKTFDIYFSVEEYNLAIVMYNAFNEARFKKFSIDKNSFELYNISLMNEKLVEENEIIVKFMSPLVVRERKEQKDYYHSYQSEKFNEILKINISEQLKISNLDPNILNDFYIEPIDSKKTVVKFYEKQIEVSLGIFKISGSKQLLDYLYKAGIGSKHSAGFGMFTIL